MKDFFQHIIYKLQRAVTGQLITIGSKKRKANSSRLIVLFLLLMASCPVAHAQLYPVQVNQSIVPPYSTKLNSYATASSVKLRLYLTMTDVNINNRQVRLKLKIKGHGLNIQSADFVQGAPQIFLNGGMQQQLTNIDLAPYFEMNNLLGINPQQYNRPLPDGTYKFCWEVYDFLTGQLISSPNMGCDTIFLLLNDPPFLNLPNRGDQLTDIQPTNIIFQWTPRHASATNVSYEFELRELWDRQIDPQAGFMASPNYYTETTYATTLLYTIGKPTLLPGHTYAWRVRARSTTGLSENSVFKNDGYSEIFHFTYTNTCYPPSFVLAEPLNRGTVKINWQTNPDHKKYHIQYKRADVTNAEWFEVFSYNNQAQISNLQAGVTYNFRVGGTCNALIDFDQDYTYSSINQFTTPTADESISYSCGIVPELEITNSRPLANIGVNETFTAGDFPVTIKEIEGGNGIFSGKGYIVVPYLADTKIAVAFSAIRINTDYQLFDGVIKTTYDRTWGSVADVDDLFNGNPGQQNTREVNFPIAEIIIDSNGDILVVGVGGSPIVEYAGGEDYIITDSGHPGDPNGIPPIPASPPKKYHVDEKGLITPIGEQATGGASTAQNTNGVDNNGEATTISAQGLEVVFTQAPKTVYGFDAYNPSYPETKGLYKKLGSNYYIPYKSVTQGQTDYIVANLNIVNDSIRPQDIIFKTKDGVAIAKVDSTGTNKITSYTLKLTGLATDATVETQAVIKQDGTYKIAGAFIQYQATSKDVNVVLVNTARNVNIKEVKNKLIAIYKQALVNLSITEINDFENDLNELTSTGTIDSGESGFLANYTTQQQAINSKIKSRPDYTTRAYYLILTDKKPSTLGQKGLMPLGKQFGYVYMGNADVKTPAHELGHGAFQLKHPFSTRSYGLKESTNWLMDYANGIHITYEHWKEIHNPKLRIGVFDGDKEGELGGGIWLTANWKPFSFNSSRYINSSPNNVPSGVVPAIFYNGKNYVVNGDKYFYENEELPIKYEDNLKDDDYVYLFKYGGGECGNNAYYRTKWGFLKDRKNDFSFEDKELKLEYVGLINCRILNNKNDCDQAKYFSSIDEFYQESINKAVFDMYANLGNPVKYAPNRDVRHLKTIGSIPTLKAEDLQVYEDKLRLLNYHTGKKVMVLFFQTENNMLFSDDQLNAMAKIALEKVNAKDAALLLVSRSYVENFLFVNTETTCNNIGGYANGTLSSIPVAFTKRNFNTDFLSYFSRIPKPVNVHYVTFLADNSIVNFYQSSSNKKFVTGFPFINHLVILKSSYFDAVKEQEKKRPELMVEARASGVGSQPNPDFDYEYPKWKAAYEKLFEEAKNADQQALETQQENHFVVLDNNPINLREPYIESITNPEKDNRELSYARHHSNKYKSDAVFANYFSSVQFVNGNFADLTNEHLYSVINKDQLVYNAIDATSLMLAPTGLDFLPDLAGVVYAGVKRDYTQMGMYGVGVVAFGVTQYAYSAAKLPKYIKFNVVGHLDETKNITHYSIRNINEVINAQTEVHFTTSLAKNLDEAKTYARLDNLPLEKLDDMLDFFSDLPIGFTNELKDALRTDVNGSLRMLFDGKTKVQKVELADNWKLLYNNGRTGSGNLTNAITKNVKAIEALRDARKLSSTVKAKMGLTDDVLANLAGYNSGNTKTAYSTIVNDLTKIGKKLEANPNTTFTDFDKVLNKLNKSYNDPLKGGNSKGAHGVLKTLDDEFDNLLKGNSIKFEKRVENARDINSMSAEDLTVELLIDGQIIKRIEVKYCTNCVDEKTIIKQFIERDLYNATNINQIKWKVYGQDFTKSDLSTILSSTDGKKALEELNKTNKFQELFPNERINSVEGFIAKLNQDDIFKKMFK